jgi:hypothetical protein
MLNADLVSVDLDDDTLTYSERVELYSDAWDSILKKGDGNALVAELTEVIERELAAGFWPKEQYAKEPFRSIARLMDKHSVGTTELGVFLKWRAKNANLTKARAAKKKPGLKPKQKAFIDKFLVGKRGKPIRSDADL